MIIPGQLPQFVAVARSGALQALALQAGQILSGEVIGPAPNGGTQVKISGQLLNLVLPQAAGAGETLRFEVQGSGAQLRLALQTSASRPQASATPTSEPLLAGSPPSTVTPQTTPSQNARPLPLPPDAAEPRNIPAASNLATTGPKAAAPAAPNFSVAANPSSSLAPGAQQASPASSGTGPAAASLATPNSPQSAGRASPTGASIPTSSGSPEAPPGQPVPGGTPRQATPYPSATTATVAVTDGSSTAAIAPSAVVSAGSLAAVPAAAVAPIAASSLAPVFPGTPEAAIAQMVQSALPQQNTIANLMTALVGMAGKVALPEPVVRVAQQLLANRVSIDGGKLDGAALQKAVLNSGVFQEANLARGGTPLLQPQADTKAALLGLRQSLSAWLGQQPQLLASISQTAPPLRGRVARAPVLDIAPIDPAASVEETGKHLLDRTEAALARTRLHQHASLPDPHVKGADWSADLPVIVGGQQSMLQVQIHRDEQNGTEQAGERGWQMRFAINLPEMGEVGAQVSLRGGATSAMLWAAERETSDTLAAEIESLRDAFTMAGLSPGAVIVRHGAPPDIPQPANSGHLVDSRR